MAIDDPQKLAVAAQEEARAAAEKARQEADELEQMMLERSVRKMAAKADNEPQDLIKDEDLDVLKIG